MIDILDKFEEQVLSDIGITIRDSNENPIPTETIIAKFKARWSELTPYQQIITAIVVEKRSELCYNKIRKKTGID